MRLRVSTSSHPSHCCTQCSSESSLSVVCRHCSTRWSARCKSCGRCYKEAISNKKRVTRDNKIRDQWWITKGMFKCTYAIEPHVKPTSRYPSSDIESAEGAPMPSVTSLVGTRESLRLHLKRAPDVEKKNTLLSVGSNSSCMAYPISLMPSKFSKISGMNIIDSLKFSKSLNRPPIFKCRSGSPILSAKCA